MSRFVFVLLLWLLVWLGIPWCIGELLKYLHIWLNDYVIASEVIYLISSISIMIVVKDTRGYGLSLADFK